MTAGFQQASPLPREMQWCDVRKPHREKVRMKVGSLLSIPLDRLTGEFTFGVLREEVVQ